MCGDASRRAGERGAPTDEARANLVERLWNATNDPNSGAPPHIVELLQDAIDAIPRAASAPPPERAAPEAPVHLDNHEAAAWQSGWESGYAATPPRADGRAEREAIELVAVAMFVARSGPVHPPLAVSWWVSPESAISEATRDTYRAEARALLAALRATPAANTEPAQ